MSDAKDIERLLHSLIPTVGHGWCLDLTQRKQLEFIATALAVCTAKLIEAINARAQEGGASHG